MGEATPAQPAAGGFEPMLGVGMVGSMPGGGVTGPLSSSRGSAVPQLHSAIVERLRARIELCRRHHSTCENRYQRGQAENSDREHESTLHLLNIVHQGPGNRKTKGTRASNQQPPDYNRVNGEQKGQSSSDGDQKISTRIALHGSLRRKIEGHIPGYKQNGLSCGPPEPDYKRIRLEGGAGALGGHGPCSFSSGPSQSLGGGSFSMSHALNRKGNSSYMMPQDVVNSDLFNMTLKEMKKEPIEHVTSCGQTSTEMMVFDFKDEIGGSQIDPELQDLFDELTKSVPSINDLEFEKMLKPDDSFGLADLERSAATLCSHMEKPIKTEFSSPEFGQSLNHGGPPQLRPASAGPSFSTSSSSPVNIQKGLSQGPSGQAGAPCRGLPGWPEMSHAEQLKQMAANQNQTPLHHHQHPHQQSGVGGGPGTSWNPHPSSRAYPQDKLSNSGSQGQRMANPQTAIGSQSKGINNCLFKSNGHNGSSQLDMKVVSNKPMLHFSPKTPHPHPNVGGPLSKTSALQQPPSTPTQNLVQSHPVHHYQNQQLPMSGSPLMQPKDLAQRTAPLSQHGANHGPVPGLHFKLAQQRQMPPGPSIANNSSLLGLSSVAQQRPSVPGISTQQQVPGQGKTQAILAQQQAPGQGKTQAILTQQQAPGQGKTQAILTQQQVPGQGKTQAILTQQQVPGQGKTQAILAQQQAPGQGKTQAILTQQQHIIKDSEKGNGQDQFNRHLTRPPSDYQLPQGLAQQTRGLAQQTRGLAQQTSLFTGVSSSQSSNNGLEQNHLPSMSCHKPSGPGAKMTPQTGERWFGSGPEAHQLQQLNNQRIGAGGGLKQNKSGFPGPHSGQGNVFGVGSHPGRTSLGQQGSGRPSQGPGQSLGDIMGWPGASPSTMGPGVQRLANSLQPQGGQTQAPLHMASHQYPLGPRQMGPGPPNQVAPDVGMLPLNPALRGSSGTARPGQTILPHLPGLTGHSQAPPDQRHPVGSSGAGVFPPHNPGGNYQNSRVVNRLTFDFLPEGDNTVPGINTDSDFIDSLLKSGSGNDDWMKDINLDEILGSHS